MYEVYDNWSKLAKEVFSSNLDYLTFENINHIVFTGMGGSGALGDVLKAILSNSSIYVNIVKGFTLLKAIGKNTLIVTTSISGSIIETLTVLKSPKDFGCKVVETWA